jgi:hypothetical protein
MFIGLLAAIGFGIALPLRVLLPWGPGLRLLGPWLLVGLPVYCSSAIYCILLRDSGYVPLAFGSNLLGSAAGGIVEYASLAFGIGSPYVIAAVFYLVAWILCRHPRSTSPRAPSVATCPELEPEGKGPFFSRRGFLGDRIRESRLFGIEIGQCWTQSIR